MRLTIRHQANPDIIVEVEDSPAQCAEFIAVLERSTEFFKPARSQHKTSRSRAKRPERPQDARPYAGRTNRRRLILDTMRSLAEQGNTSPSLAEIKERFLQLFPEHSTDHLDQVVRDLVNKTDQLIRSRRGEFTLAS